jgi:predicted ATPase
MKPSENQGFKFKTGGRLIRSATSLARLHQRGGRTTHARKVLAPVYRRFTEGLGTADLMTAKALLDTLR